MRVEVDLPNKDSAMYPGMYATLTLNVGSSDITPWVPDDALMFRGGDALVPVVRKTVFTSREWRSATTMAARSKSQADSPKMI